MQRHHYMLAMTAYRTMPMPYPSLTLYDVPFSHITKRYRHWQTDRQPTNR